MGTATEFVRFDTNTKRFDVSPDALRTLQRLSGPVAVVAVCGRARQGKWSQPISRRLPDGTPYHLVLVDCEGIDAFDQTLDYSTQIFSLGVLLSSLIIYNQMGGIDESSIDKLSNVCEFAKLIRSKSQGQGSNDSQELSPSFLWLLRDFQFQLTEDGRQITTNDYMEETLRDMPGNTESVHNRNQMRASIKALFPDRDCFALVRPMNDEAQLAKMDSLPLNQLRPEFRQGLDRLTDLILTKAHPKSYYGSYITGSALAAFAQAYVGVINKGQVPMISSTWQSVMRSENQRALESALAAYQASFSEAVSAEADLLDQEHERAITAALAVLQQQGLGEPAERKVFEEKLKQQAGSRYAIVKQARLAEADSRITDLLSKATTKFSQLFHTSPVSMDQLDSELSKFLQEYDKQAVGPSKYKRIAEFMVNTLVRHMKDLARQLQSAANAASQKLDALQKELSQAKQQASDLSLKLLAAEHAGSSAKQQLLTAQQEVQRLTGELSSKAREASQAEVHQDVLQREVAELRDRAERLSQRLSSSESAQASGRQQLLVQQQEAARLSAEVADKGRQLAALQREVEDVRAQANSTRISGQTQAQQLEMEVNRLKAELQFASSRKEAAESETARVRSDLAQQLRLKDDNLAQVRSELAAAQQSAQRAADDSQQLQLLSQQLADRDRQVAEKELTIQRLQDERTFLQQQYDELRRTSLSPGFGAPGSAATAAAAAAAAGAANQRAKPLARPRTDADADMEDVDEAGPSNKRARGLTNQPFNFHFSPSPAPAAAAAAAAPPAPVASPLLAPGAAAAADVPASPFSQERLVLRSPPGASPSGLAAGLAAVQAVGGSGDKPLPDNLSRMTINEMKAWLTDQGFEADVYELNKKSKVKKDDWVKLIRSKCQ